MLPSTAVDEFSQIYQKLYGLKLDHEEAKNRAENFIRLMALIINDKKETNG